MRVWARVLLRTGTMPNSWSPKAMGSAVTGEMQGINSEGEDTASCINRGEHWTATIMPMDPKRAKVNCSEGTWSVPCARSCNWCKAV